MWVGFSPSVVRRQQVAISVSIKHKVTYRSKSSSMKQAADLSMYQPGLSDVIGRQHAAIVRVTLSIMYFHQVDRKSVV